MPHERVSGTFRVFHIFSSMENKQRCPAHLEQTPIGSSAKYPDEIMTVAPADPSKSSCVVRHVTKGRESDGVTVETVHGHNSSMAHENVN